MLMPHILWSPIFLTQTHHACLFRIDSATVCVYIWQGAVETFVGIGPDP